MEEDQTSSELSHGSEARPNTPLIDPFAGLEILEDNNERASTTKDFSGQLWIPEDNTVLRNHSNLVSYIYDSNPTPKFHPKLFHKYIPTKQKTLPNLSPLAEEPNLNSKERNTKDELIKDKNERNGQKMDRKSNGLKRFKESQRKSSNEKANDSTVTDCSKCVIPLPKIDTYCISYIRPSTNHGFGYAVSSTDLLHAKNVNITPRRAKQQKINSRCKEFQSTTPEHSLPHQGSVYLLFRAPSRACGLSIPGLRARTKELHHLKGAKQLKKSKATIKTNIVRLPDINEDMWK